MQTVEAKAGSSVGESRAWRPASAEASVCSAWRGRSWHALCRTAWCARRRRFRAVSDGREVLLSSILIWGRAASDPNQRPPAGPPPILGCESRSPNAASVSRPQNKETHRSRAAQRGCGVERAVSPQRSLCSRPERLGRSRSQAKLDNRPIGTPGRSIRNRSLASGRRCRMRSFFVAMTTALAALESDISQGL